MKHNHPEPCKHELAYCEHCDAVFCVLDTCQEQWQKPKPVNINVPFVHEPGPRYWLDSHPTITTTTPPGDRPYTTYCEHRA